MQDKFMKEILMQHEVQMLLLGAIISLISSLFGMLSQIFVSYLLENKGKVKLYIKSVYNKNTGAPWGFYGSSDEMIFNVPLWIEIHNTKSRKQIVRNINLILYNGKQQIGRMVQISHYTNSKEVFYYGDNGAYSFLLEANEIRRFDLEFAIKKKEIKSDFTEVRLAYFDSRDKYREYKVFDVLKSWEASSNRIDSDWRLMK